MASSDGPMTNPLRADAPQARSTSMVDLDHGHSDSEEPQQRLTAMEEDDMQSVVGVSISREQTRMKFPRTPAIERAAVIDKYGRDGFFDWRLATDQARASDSKTSYHGYQAETQSANQPMGADEATLPSPWISAPKLFERTLHQSKPQEPPNARRRAPTGPMGMLLDLNIKRFMSSLSMPTLPKSPATRGLSIPTLATLFGTSSSSRKISPVERADPQHPTASGRQERAHTVVLNEPQWLPERPASPAKQAPRRKDAGSLSSDKPTERNNHANQVANKEADSHRPHRDVDNHPSPQLPLKRATSDQSLALRRASSLASSLGDDSRWANVQRQVNSRKRAFVDSLQDSNVRLPSLPSLPNVNIGSLRPEYFRNRATSDTTRPRRTPEQNGSDTCTAASEAQQEQLQATFQVKEPRINSLKAAKRNPKFMHSHLDRALESLTGDIVILGGYRGSVLRSAKPPHRQLWVPVKVGLNIRRVNLEVGLEPEDEIRMEESIIPSGMLSHIGPIDMGRRLLKRLRACQNAQEGKLRVHDYGYDWRLSPHLLSQRLIQYLEQLRATSKALEEKGRGATVIAHSLGGLITRHAVNQRPDLFAGVLYAGVPQYCINILGPLRNGDEVLLSSKVLTAQVNFTLRTSFLLLPDNGVCFVDKQSKEEYPVNFFDVAEWKRYAFSPCIALASPPLMSSERKTIFGTVTDSLTSLALVGRRESSPNQATTTENQPDRQRTPGIADPNPHLDHHAPYVGSSSAPRSTIPLEKAEQYLTRTLANTLRFKDELKFNLQHSQENKYPPLSVLYSTSVPTVSRARVASKATIKCQDAYDDLAFASGDGVCLARAAMLPTGYECVSGGKIRTERGHVGLLGDLEAVGKCLMSLIDGRRKGIGLGPGHC